MATGKEVVSGLLQAFAKLIETETNESVSGARIDFLGVIIHVLGDYNALGDSSGEAPTRW